MYPKDVIQVQDKISCTYTNNLALENNYQAKEKYVLLSLRSLRTEIKLLKLQENC